MKFSQIWKTLASALPFIALITSTLAVSQHAAAGMITPEVIFGSGNANRGFEVARDDDMGLELGLRAKLRYGPTGPNDELGEGIIQDPGTLNYLLDSTGQSCHVEFRVEHQHQH